ncbi:hypothetical protein MPER_01977, partial [Moniliophthora perniciosa FA553]
VRVSERGWTTVDNALKFHEYLVIELEHERQAIQDDEFLAEAMKERRYVVVVLPQSEVQVLDAMCLFENDLLERTVTSVSGTLPFGRNQFPDNVIEEPPNGPTIHVLNVDVNGETYVGRTFHVFSKAFKDKGLETEEVIIAEPIFMVEVKVGIVVKHGVMVGERKSWNTSLSAQIPGSRDMSPWCKSQ